MYTVMVGVSHCIKEPDGGITEWIESEEADGDWFETYEEAEDRMNEYKEWNPDLELWILERS